MRVGGLDRPDVFVVGLSQPVAQIFNLLYRRIAFGQAFIPADAPQSATPRYGRIQTKTKKSAISRLENHAEDVRLSALQRVTRALEKTLRIAEGKPMKDVK